MRHFSLQNALKVSPRSQQPFLPTRLNILKQKIHGYGRSETNDPTDDHNDGELGEFIAYRFYVEAKDSGFKIAESQRQQPLFTESPNQPKSQVQVLLPSS